MPIGMIGALEDTMHKIRGAEGGQVAREMDGRLTDWSTDILEASMLEG